LKEKKKEGPFSESFLSKINNINVRHLKESVVLFAKRRTIPLFIIYSFTELV